ncbi:glycosyltransferase family 4 protein [Flavivirga jejuensis]|uniref:Glycosyltransferase family 4 protein n=1 Tax=Flavivirga jejuensis TaxID=870487 RepID=A0ABT8WT98_9FLAO|nr:glycosyltransferase family 4 protein [Flavivirga jejuensis]MDO5976380.1 glycosyltransferase family 4 protein [Flavivirga jejuensis]
MKVVVLHPPLYPINHKFFNELGKHLELVVYSFGNQPGLHSQWKVENFIDDNMTYNLKIIKGKTNLKRFAVSYRTQLNPSFLFQIKKENPDIVVSVAFWFPSLYIAFFKSFFKCKLLILTDAIKQTETNNSVIRNTLRNFIARKTTAFIASSDLTVTYLKERFPNVDIKKSVQTIDVIEWKNSIEKLESKSKLKEALGFSKDKTVLLSVSNYIPLKNLEKLIDEVILMPNCELYLIGKGDLKDSYEAKIKDHKVSDRIRLVGRKEGVELKKYYKASDIFVFPSNRDTFGYVVIEALASGLPVICSENAGASSIIENTKNGYVLHPQEDFTNCINDTINNLEKMSLYALNSVSKYTIENKAKDFFKTLTNIN